MKKTMNGWSKDEIKAAEAEARRTGGKADEVAKDAQRRLKSFFSRGALYRRDVLG